MSSGLMSSCANSKCHQHVATLTVSWALLMHAMSIWICVWGHLKLASVFETVYKQWICAQFFHTTQMHCSNRIPCRKYCLEVQQRCPFILPDNDELIYGGSPSFICTGLHKDNPSDEETECCDVRWDSRTDNSSKGTLKRTHPSCQHGTSLTSSAASRLCNSRLKFCLLVLVLLHTVATLTASHNPTGFNLTSNSSNEE
ncbi:Transmembrane protein FAM155A [Triplophysa tibetana]|uniref:Transmembrane protein FAM155A n=1 Tax=Triplophysa tibetana TaxID=1572043 RepID=A0A5A9P5T2_9TELE|nr:Transmembrane protein FAM155A [Triplophysa tibetana]